MTVIQVIVVMGTKYISWDNTGKVASILLIISSEMFNIITQTHTTHAHLYNEEFTNLF